MEASKGNIMNRPIKSNIRDKNHTHNGMEESKQSTEM